MSVLRLVPAIGTPVMVTKDTAVVGREPGSDVYVNDGSVSRRHAQIELRRGAWFVVDQRSANGTFLDSQRVSDALLRQGQEVRFGMVSFRVEILEGGGTSEGTVLGAPGYPGPSTPARPGPSMTQPGWPSAPGAPRPGPPAAPAWPGPPAPPPAPPYAAPPAPPPAPPMAYRPVAPGAPPAIPPPGAPWSAAPGAPAAPYARVPPPAPPRPPGLPPLGPAARIGSSQETGPVGPVPKEGRGALFWVAMGCGGALFLVALFMVLAIGGAVGLPFLLSRATRAPVAAAEAELAEIRRGDLAAAHAHLSDGYKAQVSREALEAFVARHPVLKDQAAVSFPSRSVVNDTADLAGFLGTTGAGEALSFHLVQEGGVWKVAGIEVGGDRLEGRPARTGAPSVIKVETAEVQKRREGSMIKVAVKVNVSGFQVRPEGDRFAIDLAEDVETIGPLGERIEALSRPDVQRFTGSTSFEEGAVASLSTPLLLDRGSAPGSYRVRVTIRDLVGGGQASHDVAFQLP